MIILFMMYLLLLTLLYLVEIGEINMTTKKIELVEEKRKKDLTWVTVGYVLLVLVGFVVFSIG